MEFKNWMEAAYRNKNNCPYWGDGGAGVLPFAKNTKKFLVSHRGTEVNEGGTFGLFGGGIFLDQTPYEDMTQLASTNYPKQHAIEELREETGYSGPIQMVELYVFKDNKKNAHGEPCDFIYWNYLGICPQEFPVSPGEIHKWEEGGKSGWLTLQELLGVNPKHFGLKALLQNAGSKLAQIGK